MNKLKVILVVLILPLLLTGCKKKVAEVMPYEQTSQEEITDNGMFKGSLKDLMQSGKAQKCVTTYEDDGGVLTTEIYVDGKRSYVESIVDTPEQDSFVTYSLFDEEWFYSWSGEGIATKMRIDEMEELGADLEETIKGDSPVFDKDEALQVSDEVQNNLSYKCEDWKVDENVFMPPSDIEFTDMAQTMRDFVSSVEDGELMGSMCGVCTMLADEDEIAECRVNMGCE